MGRAGWGAVFATLIVAAASCSSPTVKPTPSRDIQDARPLAREIADILLTFSAYDYGLIGSLGGERVRVVPPDRYAVVARAQAALITENAPRIVAAASDTAGPIHDRLVTLADALAELRADALAYSDARQADTFARVITDVNKGWALLGDLRSLLSDDGTLDAAVARGTAMKAAAAPGAGALVTIGPFADAADAAAHAKLLGPSGVPSATSPFYVRATYTDRAAADAAAAALLKQSIVALVVDQTSYAFTRSGPAPDAELWREAERSIDTHGQARRIALTINAGMIATGSDDGTVAIFSGDGLLRSLLKLSAGVNQLVFSDDAKFLLGGGQTLWSWAMPRPTDSVGVPIRLRNAAQTVVYVPTTNAFAASSAGDGTFGGVVGGRAPDGVPLGEPFPIEVASSGALLGASDAGDLFVASQIGAQVDLRILHVGGERVPRVVLRIPGTLRAFAVDTAGAHGAMVTDQGTFQFAINVADPAKSIARLGAPVRDVEFGRDGVLYLLDARKLTAVSTDGATKWAASLVDGRRIAVGVRPVVLDGTDSLVAFSSDGTPDRLAPVGLIGDLVASRDGKWIGVIADARRAVLFKLP